MADRRTYSAWDFIQAKLREQKYGGLPTKEKFGELMHGDLDDDEKREIAEKVLLAGGYDALEDDN